MSEKTERDILKEMVADYMAKLPEGFAFAINSVQMEVAGVVAQDVIGWLPETPVVRCELTHGNLIVYRPAGLQQREIINLMEPV